MAWKIAGSSILLTFGLAVGLMADGSTADSSSALNETDKTIEGLRHVTRELNDSVKTFYTHLDQAMARYDHGYRGENGRAVQSADADLIGGPPDITWPTMQKFAAFRMLAASEEGQKLQDPAVNDMRRIEQLIVEARRRVDASTPTLRKLLVVSVADYTPENEIAAKGRHEQLLRARGAAEEAAQKAMLALPLDQPESSAAEQTAERTWEMLGRGVGQTAAGAPGQAVGKPAAPAIPIILERRRRVTLVNEGAYRMALTDSGMDDGQGRHVFYQEEWVQRGQSVIRYRWRVGVDGTSGQQVLLRRYPPRELHGSIEDVYKHLDRDYVWYLEAPDDAMEPARGEVEAALDRVALARDEVRVAAQEFRKSTGDALAEQDRIHAAMDEPPVDSGLPQGLRARLFAIRAHLAHVQAVLASEDEVRKKVTEAESRVRDLEPLAAWSNRDASVEWTQILDRSDREIDSVRNAETEALEMLPPDSPSSEEQFPELAKNTIIRMRHPRTKNAEDTSVHCLQEVWRMEIGPLGTREVRRAVSLILIDPKSGNQTRVGGATRYYKVSDGDLLEEIFDEYAADEVRIGS